MNVITLGSKIFDDAINQIGIKITNQERITNISPFTFSHNYKYTAEITDDTKEYDYIKKIASYEVTGKDWNENLKYDVVIIDMLDARLPFDEILFENGMKLRVSRTASQRYSEEIISKYFHNDTVIEHKTVEPMALSDEQLEAEIKKFADFLVEKYDIDKIVLLENYNVSQMINSKYEIAMVPNYGKITEYNRFYRKCDNILKKCIKVINVSMPTPNMGDARQAEYNFFMMSRPYYKFLVSSILCSDKEKENREIYETEIFDMINMTEIPSFIQRIVKEVGNKEIVFIGDSKVTRQLLKERYGLDVKKHIEYYPWTTECELKAQIQDYANSRECYFIINRLYGATNILGLLGELGLSEGDNFILISHKTLKYENFSGDIQDVFNNRICCSSPTDIYISGWANSINIHSVTKTLVYLKNLNTVMLDRDVCCNIYPCLKVVADEGCSIYVGKRTRIMNGMKILAGSFSKIKIGKDCLFSTDITLKILEDKVCNKPSRKEIKISDAVWVGYRVYIMSDTYIGQGSVVGARTVVWNKKIPNNCIVVGEDGRVIRKNIVWDSEPFLHSIQECNSEYIQYTQEVE